MYNTIQREDKIMQFNEIFIASNNKMIALSLCRAADESILIPVLRLVEERNITVHLVDDIDILKEKVSLIDKKFLTSANVKFYHIDNDADAAKTAVSLAANNVCNILMKGMIPTSVILKEVLKKDHRLIDNNLLSHVALFDLPNYHKAVLMSDGAMNIKPNPEQLKLMINNVVNTAHYLNITHPKIALLAAVEKVNDKMESTVNAKALEDYYKNDADFTVEGPLQYDLAVSSDAVKLKGLDSEVAGDADILIVPEINAGNILYKSLVYSADTPVASNVVGAKVPIVLTSRADNIEDKYNSICLAIYSINSNI